MASLGRMRRFQSSWRLHLVSDDAFVDGDFLRKVQGALIGGADVIQLRFKHASTAQFLRWAAEVKPLCHSHNAALIVNDRVDVALACGADGVHVGRGEGLQQLVCLRHAAFFLPNGHDFCRQRPKMHRR